MSIEAEIDALLQGAGIQAFHHAAPQHANAPFTVYKVAERETLNTLNGYGGLTRTDFVFDSWAGTWQAALAQRDAVVAALRASSFSFYELPAGENAFDDEVTMYMESCAFSIWHH
jgi:hypothetical protein